MNSSPEPAHSETRRVAEADSLLDRARRHPIATSTLIASGLVGAVICVVYLPESISLARRVVGGLLVGGLSWLLVMMGRLLD
ncbi:MAG: hypothetical protein JRH17_14805 [Deltaproteobacteria bacterium]|nr:hypothetical protein [Deltaproteobacteria bacterium]